MSNPSIEAAEDLPLTGRDGDKHLRVRLGGSVKRFHTWPTIGEQTVAAHTWGVLAIILDIHPMASAALLRRAVYHDLAEYDTGDTPSTAKWSSPNLKTLLDELEKTVNMRHGFGSDVELSPLEVDVLKMADLMEMLWYSYEQYMLGNRNLKTVYLRVCEAINKRKWIEGDYAKRAWKMTVELEQLWMDTEDGEPS